ncbi:unnamed protein product [Schistocephalus solidus]|uniref:C2H2-type domain-containing protein n=1 Tax=Schistocephalus solidus TaxID=70667 RepID=A0A183SGC1_SCHSO|nr:unnamed protein product [Schistocephalus solidus]
MNQCLQHQHTAEIAASTALTVLTHSIIVFGHMRIHDSGIHHSADNTDTPCTPSAPAILADTATTTTLNDIPPVSPDFSCPHCARNFNSGIGLVGHLRIHRTQSGEPVLGLRHVPP